MRQPLMVFICKIQLLYFVSINLLAVDVYGDIVFYGCFNADDSLTAYSVFAITGCGTVINIDNVRVITGIRGRVYHYCRFFRSAFANELAVIECTS